jgi:hypothetical protein
MHDKPASQLGLISGLCSISDNTLLVNGSSDYKDRFSVSALVLFYEEEILRNQWIVLSGLRNLRIASKDGGPCNEYRIQDHAVEFRAVDSRGKRYSHLSKWRVLDAEEIKLHFALQTPVADWLDKNLYSSASA